MLHQQVMNGKDKKYGWIILKPYVDEFITDTYGSAVAVINPKADPIKL